MFRRSEIQLPALALLIALSVLSPVLPARANAEGVSEGGDALL
ncbi:MAG: hypothetical protein H6Q84_3166, partial [Deltaproteobacteria bacterium]|nr:hypothetical protein [Deltaproteobacteria bacterium]